METASLALSESLASLALSTSSSEPSLMVENCAVELDCEGANKSVSSAVDAVELQHEGAAAVTFAAIETSVLSRSSVE